MEHWTRLRQTIEDRGLSALVADSGKKAAANLASEVVDGRTIDNFDPLMAAHNAILGNVVKLTGLAVMVNNEDGSERCPLCYLNQRSADSWEKERAGGAMIGAPYRCGDDRCGEEHLFPPAAPNYDAWIDRAAYEAVAEWKRLGA